MCKWKIPNMLSLIYVENNMNYSPTLVEQSSVHCLHFHYFVKMFPIFYTKSEKSGLVSKIVSFISPKHSALINFFF